MVTKTKGTLSVKPTTGQEHDVTTAQRTREGDTLKTSAASLADIALADTARVRLGPSTTARVLRTDGGLTLDLTQGGVCIVATSGQVGVSSGVTLTTATAPAIYSVATGDAGATVLAVYQGEVRTGGGVTAEAGQAYTFSPTGAETAVLLSSLATGLAALECPDPDVIAATKDAPLPKPTAGPGGGGGGAVLGILGGLGLIAAAAGGGGGKGGSSGPAPGALAVAPGTVSVAAGSTATVTATEADYLGPITATSSASTIATVTASGSGPSATFTVTGIAPGSATLTFADNHGQSQTVAVTVPTPGTLTATPATLSLASAGATATVTAAEPNYTGAITATSSAAGVATVTASGTGPSATFTVTAVGPGTATLKFTDNHAQSQTVAVTVYGPLTISLSPATLSFSATTTAPQTFTATEANYTGAITVTASTPNIVSVAPASANGPGPATFTVTPLNGGQTTLTVSDANTPAKTATISVTVSSGTIALAPGQLSLSTGNGTTPNHATFTATETNYTGPITAQVASGSATVTPASGNGPGPVTFTVTATAPGPALIAIADTNPAHNSFLNVTVTGPLAANPVTISGISGTLTATEPYYSGAIGVALASSCANVVSLATASPQTATGGAGSSASFSLAVKAPGTCSATVTDDPGQNAVASITVSAGTFTVTPSTQTVNTAGNGNTATITVTDTNYTGTISAAASGGVSVSPASGNGPGPITFTVTAGTAGTGSVTISDTIGHSTPVAFTITGPLTAANASITVPGTGTVAVTEPYYSGTFTIALNAPSCNGVVTLSGPATVTASNPGTASAGTSYTFTGVSQGSCSATVSDLHGASDPATINVSAAGAVTLNPSAAQTINAFGTAAGATTSNPFTVNASEAGFTGNFTAVSDTPGVATVTPALAAGPSANFTITGKSGGTAIISIDDATVGHTVKLTVTVTGMLSPPAGPLTITSAETTGTLTATEVNYGSSISANLTGCTNIVSTASPQNGPSATFTFTAGTTAGSCTVTFSDLHGQTTTPATTITVQPGAFTASADTTTINSAGTGTTATITATEFRGAPFHATSSDGTATVSGPSGSGSPATFTVTGKSGGTPTISVFDALGSPAKTIPFTVTGTLSAPASQTYAWPASGSIIAAEPYFTGQFTIALATPAPAGPCTAFLNLTSAASLAGSGGQNSGAAFTFNTLGDGTCIATITDDHGSPAVTTTITVGTGVPASNRRRSERYAPIGSRAGVAQPVSAGGLTASDSSVVLRIAQGANGVHTVSIAEAGYAGAFSVVNSHPEIATAALSAAGAGRAQLTLTALTSGTTLVTIADANNNHLTIPVTVTSSRITNPSVRRSGTN